MHSVSYELKGKMISGRTTNSMEIFGQLPAELKQLVVKRLAEGQAALEALPLFDVEVECRQEEQIANVWSSYLKGFYEAEHGEGSFEAIAEMGLTYKDSRGEEHTKTLKELDMYLYGRKKSTISLVRVYAINALKAGEEALNMVSGTDKRVLSVNPAKTKGK